MPQLRVRAGRVIGRDHVLNQSNCQDAHALVEKAGAIAAFVCDGCGSGAHSEVGAALAALYLAQRAGDLLTTDCPLGAIPGLLHADLVAYLRQLVDVQRPANREEFIREYLLFTALGILTRGVEGLIVAAGDGVVLIDEAIHRRDEQNTPRYMAYHLVGNAHAPAEFDAYPLPPDWTRIAIASDGFTDLLFGDLHGLAHPRSLQRRLNVWSTVEKQFRDDATVVLLENLNGGRDAGHA